MALRSTAFLAVLALTGCAEQAPRAVIGRDGLARAPVRVTLINPADRSDGAVVISMTVQVFPNTRHMAADIGGPLVQFVYPGPDCQPVELVAEVTQKPAHGSIRFMDGRRPMPTPAPFANGDPRAACAMAPARVAYFQPDRGFIGRDHTVLTFHVGDQSIAHAVDMVVRARVGAWPPADNPPPPPH